MSHFKILIQSDHYLVKHGTVVLGELKRIAGTFMFEPKAPQLLANELTYIAERLNQLNQGHNLIKGHNPEVGK